MSITNILISWYNSSHRNLPWRNNKTPYVIWISEIILQQTQVNQGLPYFNRFINRFPNIKAVAEATEDDVLLLWQGLGYYTRARNLHAAAKQITNDFNDHFPTTYHDIIKLKGVGEYTAAAIASFCFDEAVPAIDGNVNRVISRLFNIPDPVDTRLGKKLIKQLCEQLIPKDDAATFNQATMEFGATICSPKNPKCDTCPLLHKCEAHKVNTINIRPVKKGKTKQSHRYFIYLVLLEDESTYIIKRTKKDIWKGLFEFPLIETDKEINIDELKNHSIFKQHVSKATIKQMRINKSTVHILSHQKIHSSFIIINGNNFNPSNYQKTPIKNLNNFAFPTLIEKFISKLNFS